MSGDSFRYRTFQKPADEKFAKAENAGREAIGRALDAWGRGLAHFPVDGGGLGAIVRATYRGHVSTPTGTRILTEYGTIDTIAAPDAIERLFTPPRYRIALEPLSGDCGFWSGKQYLDDWVSHVYVDRD